MTLENSIVAPFVLRIWRRPNGTYAGWLDDLTRGVWDMPAEVTFYKPNQTQIEWKGWGYSFHGSLGKGVLDGKFERKGFSVPLKFVRETADKAQESKN